jgi:energy-coupling factor transporter ATP-binding protein EcfA2
MGRLPRREDEARPSVTREISGVVRRAAHLIEKRLEEVARVAPPYRSVGSRWLRWDPHIHAPGTLMNDQFGGDWDAFFRAIELAVPQPAALGIADYFTLRAYKEFKGRRLAAQLPTVELVFPNVELRLTTETRTGKGINLHLLVSPDDPDHVITMEEKLSRLTFRYLNMQFPCSDDGLRRLGREQPGKYSLPDEAALKEGAAQFKVELSEVRALFEKDAWVRANVLVAVAAGEDGLAGIARDSGFRALREELGRMADIVFSASPGDRTYWLGEHPDFKTNRQTVKPCLHGSDAHVVARVLQPDQDRRCWIRGSATFDSLRQTLAEPERRVFIGAEPPPGAPTSEVIQSLRMDGAPWLVDPNLSFNSGLVTVIGAKGSGKTALADLIALAAGAEEGLPGPASFLRKARRLLTTVKVHLQWADGSKQSSGVPSDPEPTDYPRVQYLSQQFVERLSAPDDLSEPLVEEIERVVFGAIPEEERLQTSTFAELRGLILEDPRAAQDHEREAIRNQTRVVAAEQDLERSLPALRSAAQAQERARKGLKAEIAKIPTKGGDEKLKALAAAADALQSMRDAIAASDRRAQGIKDVAAEIRRQVRSAEVGWEELRQRHPNLLEAAMWEALLPRIDAAALETLAGLEQEARTHTETLKETGEPLPWAQDATATPPSTARGLQALIADHERLAKELSLDEANARRRVDLEKRLAKAKTDEAKAVAAVAHADGASGRNKEAQGKRLDSYHRVFDAMVGEHDVLEGLYAPLSVQIANDMRLAKLSLVVCRVVDVDAWAARGEALFDLRTPPFMGHGKLERASPTTFSER